ncbi:glycosyltransferase family 2 protein [Bifidobacterium saguinibicoloris]|uniref:glycosyltransferase family 2 protein n=1 Tax=Bifidobacterium saguinibicoloris TaxID=2834433 RepID=UPI001C58E88E|nr:glycosyltransferase [Bifidobacterium saguinibicoloris]MBW3081362.1 glycosyltransferase [Bifidobacterium saguinibicoloris]
MLLTTPPDAPNTLPVVSVVVSASNAQDEVRYAVDSVLRQSHARLEVLLVDVGSSDATPAILDEYVRRDDRVSVLHVPAVSPVIAPASDATSADALPSVTSSPDALPPVTSSPDAPSPIGPSADAPTAPTNPTVAVVLSDPKDAVIPSLPSSFSGSPRFAAWNAGLDEATGEFVMLVDSTDILDRRAVELLLHALTRTDADMAKGRRDRFDAADLYEVAEVAAAGAREPDHVTVTPNPLHAYENVFRKCVRYAGGMLGRDWDSLWFDESVSCRLYRRAMWEDLRFPASDAMRAALYGRMRAMADVDATLDYRRA